MKQAIILGVVGVFVLGLLAMLGYYLLRVKQTPIIPQQDQLQPQVQFRVQSEPISQTIDVNSTTPMTLTGDTLSVQSPYNEQIQDTPTSSPKQSVQYAEPLQITGQPISSTLINSLASPLDIYPERATSEHANVGKIVQPNQESVISPAVNTQAILEPSTRPVQTYTLKTIGAIPNINNAKLGNYSKSFTCPNNGRLMGFDVSSGNFVDSIGVLCGDGTVLPKAGGNGGWNTRVFSTDPNGFSKFIVKSGDWIDSIQFPQGTVSKRLGGEGGSDTSTVECPTGGYFTELYVNYGDHVNRIYATCEIPNF